MLLDTIDGGKQEKLAYYIVEESEGLARASSPVPSVLGGYAPNTHWTLVGLSGPSARRSGPRILLSGYLLVITRPSGVAPPGYSL